MSNVRQALEFVRKTISDSETVREALLEALDREPKPITKKLDAILGDAKLRVYGIKRGTSKCEPVFVLTDDFDMTWNDNWNAWSCRPASGHYQQIMVFVPRVDE